jgi:hypothetical protein
MGFRDKLGKLLRYLAERECPRCDGAFHLRTPAP